MKRQSGFSLIEILVVVTLVGFMILLLANTPSAIRSIGISNRVSVAKEILMKKVEDIRIQGYASLANGTSSFTDSRLTKLPQGEGSVVIEDCPASICTHSEVMKQVQVTVSWLELQNGDPQTKQQSVTTFVAQGGL